MCRPEGTAHLVSTAFSGTIFENSVFLILSDNLTLLVKYFIYLHLMKLVSFVVLVFALFFPSLCFISLLSYLFLFDFYYNSPSVILGVYIP